MIDSMSMNYHRIRFKYNIILSLIFTLEAKRIKLLEKKIFNYADKVSVVSNIDKIWIDNNKIYVFPLGVDTVKFHPSSHKNSSLTIIFSGNLSYKPNEQAVLWFLENCWMKILDLHPNIILVLAGRVGSFEIRKFNKYKNIVITGEVAFIEDYIKKADIAIAPMQCGSGMQNKILEAMSCGLAVVSTPLGMGDIKAKNNYNIILAECPNKFIKSIDYLIKNKKRRNEIGAAARKLILDNYSWEKSNMIFFDHILQKRT
jgi:glycosyltransferase involved in cell wall biosynthesis